MRMPARPVSPLGMIGSTTARFAACCHAPVGKVPGISVPDHRRFSACARRGPRPAATGRLRPDAGRDDGGVAGINARGAHEGCGAGVRLQRVNHRERQVARIVGERLRAAFAGLLPGAGVRRREGEFAQQGELPRADHPLGVVGVGTEDSADAAVVGRNRAVRERVIGLFGVAVALHDQELRLPHRCPRCRPWPATASGRCHARSRATRWTPACPAPGDVCRR